MTRFRNAAAGVAMAWALLAQPASAIAPVADDDADKPGAGAPVAEDSDSIVVTGQHAVTSASGGTKTDTPLIDTPQSISVISAATISELGLQNLNQALRFVAGVTPEQRGASAEVYDQFKLRGFDAPIYLDGLRLFESATGYALPQVDVSRVERIEVIKGPSSALYGRSGPGGLVVEDSKLPVDRAFYGSLSGTYGNFDLYRVDGDVGGRLSQDVLWRIYGSVNGAHSQQEYGVRRRRTVSGAITLGSGTPTSFTVLAAYSHDPRNGNYGIFPALGTLVDNPAGRISPNFYSGEPNDFFFRNQFGLTYIFRHEFGADWSFRTLGRYQYVRSRLGIVYTAGQQADFYSPDPSPAPTIFTRYAYSTSERTNGWTYDNQLTGKVRTGPFEHELLFGADRQVAHSAELSAFGLATPINVFDPVYGTTPTPRTPAEVNLPAGTEPAFARVHQRQQGVYAQDQISWKGLRIVLSGREDWARRVSLTTTPQHDKKFTYRTAALYKTSFGIAPYFSYSTSFEPQAALLTSGALADPSLGKQIEGGIKYQVPNTDILLTAAYFHITQTNVLSSNPVTRLSDQSGKVRSRGFEFEAKAPLPYGFNAMVAFSRQSVKVLEDANPVRIGHGLPTVGRGGASANLEWTGRSGPFNGLTLGGSVRHVDHVYADIYTPPAAFGAPRPIYSPNYTLFDALIRYDLGALSQRLEHVQVGVNATNLADKHYLTSCYANYGWCWYGNRRTVQGTIGFSF